MPGRRGSSGSVGRAAVGGGVPERQVEGPVAGRRVVDQLHAAPRLEIGQVLARMRGVRIVLDHAMVERLPGHVVERGRVREPDPVGPARRHAVLGLVAVQVAADVHGAVAGVRKPDRQRVRAVELDEAAERRVVVKHAVVVGVLARQVRGARGAAEREAVDRLVELRALAGRAACSRAASSESEAAVWSSVMITTTFSRASAGAASASEASVAARMPRARSVLRRGTWAPRRLSRRRAPDTGC